MFVNYNNSVSVSFSIHTVATHITTIKAWKYTIVSRYMPSYISYLLVYSECECEFIYLYMLHYSDVTWASWRHKWPGIRGHVVQEFVQFNNKQNKQHMKVPYYWPSVDGLHHWRVNSSQKGIDISKMLPRRKVIIYRCARLYMLWHWLMLTKYSFLVWIQHKDDLNSLSTLIIFFTIPAFSI